MEAIEPIVGNAGPGEDGKAHMTIYRRDVAASYIWGGSEYIYVGYGGYGEDLTHRFPAPDELRNASVSEAFDIFDKITQA